MAVEVVATSYEARENGEVLARMTQVADGWRAEIPSRGWSGVHSTEEAARTAIGTALGHIATAAAKQAESATALAAAKAAVVTTP